MTSGVNIPAHTPGPWRADLSDGRYIVRDANDDVVADCWNGTFTEDGEIALETCEPNARLIAAAPDLKDALENLVIGIGMGWDLDGILDTARAALARVEAR